LDRSVLVCDLATVSAVIVPPRTRTPEEVVAVLALAAVEGRFPHWVDGVAVLAAFDAREWIQASDVARRHRPALTARDPQRWATVNLDEPTGFVAVLASWHADGHLREQAIGHLAGRRGPVVASALAVRLLDHVPQVREAALRALRPQLCADVVECMLGVLVAAADRRWSPLAIEAVLGALQDAGDLHDTLRRLLTTPDVRLRRWAHTMATSGVC
jgi:hypothetical protein